MYHQYPNFDIYAYMGSICIDYILIFQVPNSLPYSSTIEIDT